MVMREAILTVMKSKKLTQQGLAGLFGQPHQSFVSEKINRKSMSIDNSLMLLEKLGYEIVIRPVDGTEGAEYTITKE